MTMQNKVYLTVADWMVYCTLICFRNFTDFYQLALFCTCFERSQNSCFFFHAHIAMISTIMIPRNCFKPLLRYFATNWLT